MYISNLETDQKLVLISVSALKLTCQFYHAVSMQFQIWLQSTSEHLITGIAVERDQKWRWANCDGVKVLRPTRQKIGHLGDVLRSQSFGLVLKKLNPTQQKETTQE